MSTLSTMSLTKDKRIRKRREYLRVQRFGTRMFGRHIVAIAQKEKSGSCGRIGLVVPKKVGAAHVRNKIKRRLRHILRINQAIFFEKALVIVARDSISGATFAELTSDVIETCRKLSYKSFDRRNYARKVA